MSPGAEPTSCSQLRLIAEKDSERLMEIEFSLESSLTVSWVHRQPFWHLVSSIRIMHAYPRSKTYFYVVVVTIHIIGGEVSDRSVVAEMKFSILP